MYTTKYTTNDSSGGRTSSKLSHTLEGEIVQGRFAAGGFMLGERELSEKYTVARMTARRALKSLEARGLLRAEPGKGYRVLARGNDPVKGCPVALAVDMQDAGQRWTDLNLLMLQAVQTAAERRGWPVLGVGTLEQPAERILEQCLAARAWGLIASVHRPQLARLALQTGMPLVLASAWESSLDVDVVFQNGFLGGTQAADYLVARGHRRIAWYGQLTHGVHATTRFGGAYTSLLQHGVPLPQRFQIDSMKPDGAQALRSLLQKPDRPTAVLALWQPNLRQAADIAWELGLEIGKDLELVGWSSEEQYAQAIAAHFSGKRVPPTVVWSLADLAEQAIDRLAIRREHPQQRPVAIYIQTRIRENGRTEQGG